MASIGLKKIHYADEQPSITDIVNKNFQTLEIALRGKLDGSNIDELYLENFIASHVQAGDVLITKGTDARVYLNESTISMQLWDSVNEEWVNKMYFDSISGQYIFDGELSADTINALYGVLTPYIQADMASITELNVSLLSTAQKAIRYLVGNTNDLYYIKIYSQYVDFIKATDASGTEQATTIDGSLAYWTSAAHTAVTKEVTSWPVYQYVYTELVKQSINFTEGDADGVPTIAMGVGANDGTRNGRGFIYKSDGGLYIEYVTYAGLSRTLKLTEAGIDFSEFTEVTFTENMVLVGLTRVWVQDELPTSIRAKDVWVDTDDYTRYDITDISSNTTLVESDNEILFCTGSPIITLHSAEVGGIVKRIHNKGTGIVTLMGTINGESSMPLYPGEAVEIITSGTDWGVL